MAGVLLALVDHLDHRPARPVTGAVGGVQLAPAERLQRGARAGEHAGHPGPLRPLDGDVACVPRRRLLLLVGLVVLVEHHDARRGRRPAPRPPRASRRRSHRPRPAPSRAGCGATATPARRSRSADRGRHRRRGAQHQGVAERRSREGDVHQVRGRRQAQHRPRRRERRGEQAWSGGSTTPRLAAAREVPPRPDRGEAVLRSDAGRPAQRQAAHSASSSSSGVGPRPARLASGRSATPSGGSTPTATIHPPDAAAVELDAHHVPDAHLVPERVRDQVVEGLVDGRHVREHPDDERRHGAGRG